MRTMTCFIATSLDGYIAGANDDISWLFSDEDYGFQKFFKSCDTVLVGRRTYEISLGCDPNPFPEKDVMIVSRSQVAVAKGRIIYGGENWWEQIQTQKAGSGAGIWLVGGAELLRDSLNHHLLDELIISIHPILLGTGKSLVEGDLNGCKLELVNTTWFKNDLLQLHYKITYD